ncbi:MAG: alpha/beta hydrolase [Brevundimonas sp.]|uniref:alpha/beta hydrolase n=1 Tax=Brevundimonas sp. TaxID=1871086 RepID=UPI00272852A4|nr:alpha/beta hydrolase [Brevundimonas sp.]MDO9078897.1 alpha/beta hydrolase [Brevundimonas sp.]MDP3081918.1 alpha/beta hydrolase [Brevundimonas sp.]MDZ4059919.1 alpha/beta hydrolase [Brevundimonas sp.]
MEAWQRGRVILAVAAILTLTGCAQVIRDRVFRPSEMAASPAWSRQPETISVTTSDGLVLAGLYWAPQGTRRDVVVYFHGNGGNLYRDGAYAEPLAGEGRGLLMTSYRGYSGNAGRPTEAGLAADADAFLAEARRRIPAGGKLYVFGHSLGGAVALGGASRWPISGVATLGAFGSVSDLAPRLVRGMIPDRFDNRQAIGRIAVPITLFHGTADAIVPFTAAAELNAASGGRATVVPLEGGGHHPSMERLAPLIWQALERS